MGTDASDHASYWLAGFPAVMVTDTAFLRNPHYHTAQDTADTLDYERHALSIAEGHYPPRAGGEPGATAYRPPLYPFFLGVAYRLSPGDPRLWARV